MSLMKITTSNYINVPQHVKYKSKTDSQTEVNKYAYIDILK